jgi:hypothetical protein
VQHFLLGSQTCPPGHRQVLLQPSLMPQDSSGHGSEVQHASPASGELVQTWPVGQPPVQMPPQPLGLPQDSSGQLGEQQPPSAKQTLLFRQEHWLPQRSRAPQGRLAQSEMQSQVGLQSPLTQTKPASVQPTPKHRLVTHWGPPSAPVTQNSVGAQGAPRHGFGGVQER